MAREMPAAKTQWTESNIRSGRPEGKTVDRIIYLAMIYDVSFNFLMVDFLFVHVWQIGMCSTHTHT